MSDRYEQCLQPYIEVLKRAEKTAEAAMPDQRKILTFNELADYGWRYTRQHTDRLEKAGKFPKRVALGTYRVGWLEIEIINHMRTLVAQRSRQTGTIGSAGKIKGRGK